MAIKYCDVCNGRRLSKEFLARAAFFDKLVNFKTCSCETEEVTRSALLSSRSSSSSGVFSNDEEDDDLVCFKGQGPGQGIVCMEEDGKLIFTQPTRHRKKGELFKLTTINEEVLCYTFESADYKGRYLVADSESYNVSGEKPETLDAAYWRKPSFAEVSGNPNVDGSWFCLLYWGDRRFRYPNYDDCYFLVVNGVGSSATFTLGRKTDIRNSIFSEEN